MAMGSLDSQIVWGQEGSTVHILLKNDQNSSLINLYTVILMSCQP